jgi:NAD(P)-dependent dehydrogenase (short-subunit alcohol dehydrogenase family)
MCPAPLIGAGTRPAEGYPVSRIFVTGSTDGLGRAAAGVLISEGHDVVLHARTRKRAAALSDLAADAAGVVIGDLGQRQAPAAQARDPAFQDQLMDRLAALTGVALS